MEPKATESFRWIVEPIVAEGGATGRLLRPESPDPAVPCGLRIITGGPELVVPERPDPAVPWTLRCDQADPAGVTALWHAIRVRHAFDAARIEHPAHLSIETFSMVELRITVERLRRRRGLVAASVFASPAGFPTDARRSVAASSVDLESLSEGDPAVATLKCMAPATIAIALLHDENRNGRLDTMLGFPVEGFGFSGNPRVRFGPPKFDACRIAVTTTSPVRTLSLPVTYL